MDSKTIRKENVAAWINNVMNESDVVAPVSVGEQTHFRPIRSPEQIRWDFENATIAPTEFMLPQSEKLFEFQRRGSDVSVSYTTNENKRTLIGIRPCDVHGLRMMDNVFGGKYPDPYYQSRRKNTTLVALMCDEPCATGFCGSFNTGPSLDGDGAGADLMLVDLDDDTFFVRVFTEKGQALIDSSSSFFADATDAQAATVARMESESASNLHRTLDTEGLPEALDKMFQSPYWDKISRKCISCGTCTYLCPVCYCFDVSENTCSSDSGERTRCWDACTFNSFALMSGGHNPRPTIAEGYRQKMYHKFTYAVKRYNEPLCVGCGRCLDSCPVNLDIVRVLTEAKEY